jgi:hypothetical protein
LAKIEFKSGTFQWFYYPYLVRVENRVCLSCGVQVTGAAWRAVTRIVPGVGDLMQRTGDDRAGRVLDGRMIERSDDIVCGLYPTRVDEERRFLD